MIILEVVVIGVLILGGIAWQFVARAQDDKLRRLKPDATPWRVTVPLVLGLIIVIGCTVAGLIMCLDSGKHFGIGDLLGLIISAFVFSVLLMLQSYFSPIVFAVIASSEFYYLLERHQLNIAPIIVAPFQTLFKSAPSQFVTVYFLIVTMYSLVIPLAERLRVTAAVKNDRA